MRRIIDVIPLSQFKLCTCGKGDWIVIKIEIDNIEERLDMLIIWEPKNKYFKRFKKEMNEGKSSKKQYILHRKCRQCGFIPPPKFVTERMLNKELNC